MRTFFIMLAFVSVVFGAKLYVGADGSDVNDGSTFALRKATLQAAFDAVLSGDSLMWCGDFTISEPCTVDMNAGENISPTQSTVLFVIGCDASGNILTTGEAAVTTTTNSLSRLFYLGAQADWFCWQRIKWDGGGSGKATYCIEGPASDGIDYHAFKNCRITNAHSDGTYIRTATNWWFANCEIDNNGKGGTGSGLGSIHTARNAYCMIGCKVHNNATHGIIVGNFDIVIIACSFYRNGGSGIYSTSSSITMSLLAKNNVFALNGGSGIEMAATPSKGLVWYNNITYANGAYGVKLTTEITNITTFDYNTSYANTSGDIDINSGAFFGINNVNEEPVFVDTTTGSEDFRLQSGSPCKNTGIGPE